MLSQQNHAARGGNHSIVVGMFLCLCLASQKPSKQEFFIPIRSGCICAAFLVNVPPSGDAGKRVLEGAPAAVVDGHLLMDDSNVHLPLRHSYS